LPVKICLVKVANITGRQRDLTITYYTRPVLGVHENRTSPYIFTWRDERGVLFAENKYNGEFRGRVAFLATSIKDCSVTSDRVSFIGRSGDLSEPLALTGERLSGVTGAGIDPCAAIMGKIQLEPEEEISIVFLLGSGADVQQAAELAARFSDVRTAAAELERVREYWKIMLEAIQIHTPDDSFDVMMNGWLMYQTIACRIWARSGYYQAGGAYGFRDQLQDSMALLNTWPELTRDQILLHASRQFEEGDVQHWWHKEGGKGIRTRYSDDLLWLAFVTAEYIEKTADASILHEQVPFLKGNILNEGEDERYEQPQISDKIASLYEHCTLTIDRSLATGPHGLPLIGCGDWNDGMNTGGNKGSGESVWLGWFLISILKKFIPICRLMDDFARAQTYRDAAAGLQENMERDAWDGSWYRRAYFDDGTPLGSVHNSECKIDSISQSWSVISGAAKPHRMAEAMDAVQKYLVDSNEGIIKLLSPPFDKGNLHPGYIKGYVPGVRENGGQYTHAATWTVMAYAQLGKGDKASELFHMLNPVNHTRTELEYSRYRTEPYVIAADVYAVHPHTGRGGWTWYTGAAGWLYKVGMESIAGFKKNGDRLYINPCIPKNWDGFIIDYRIGQAVYHIEIKNPDRLNRGVSYIAVDGKPCTGGFITLSNNGFHRAEVIMGTPFLSAQEAEFNPESELYSTGSSIGNS
jgi:cyclic beta-1,2-glucan synthetase